MQKTRWTEFCTDRYQFDFGSHSFANGWAQVDMSSDTSYKGSWANPTTFEIFDFTEGDCCLTKCENVDEFKAELERYKAFDDSTKIDAYKMRDKFEALGLAHLCH